MAELLSINPEGSFEVRGHAYQIPREFSPREVYSYHRLLEPIPDIPGGTSLSEEQRALQRAFLLRRAAACIIPGLQANALSDLPLKRLQLLHRWIWEHRPDLAVDASTVPSA
jgi:hypothetical protein